MAMSLGLRLLWFNWRCFGFGVRSTSLVAAADSAVELVRALYGAAPVGSYQALIKALKRYSGQLLPLLVESLAPA